MVGLATFTSIHVPAQSQTEKQDSRLIIRIVPEINDQKEALQVFEQFAREVLAGDFQKAHGMLDPDVAKDISSDALRSRYRSLEAEFGALRMIEADSMWMAKPSENRLVIITVVQKHEWRDAQLSYALRHSAAGWRILWLKPGAELPGATTTHHR